MNNSENCKVDLQEPVEPDAEIASSVELDDPMMEEKLKKQDARSQQRLKKYWLPDACGDESSASLVGSKSVTAVTPAVYQKYVARFRVASRERELRLDTAGQVDLAMVKEMNEMFFDGAPLNNGQYLVQKRGRWQSHSSVARYGKAGQVLADFERLDGKVQRHLQQLTHNLRGHMLEGVPVPPPPR